jgi:multiple sugar transport system ATP-binding protein
MEGRDEPLTVRAGGEVDLHHGDTIYLTPDENLMHRFDEAGLAIR